MLGAIVAAGKYKMKKNKLKFILIYALTIALAAVFASVTIKPGLDAQTVATCEYWAPIRKEEYKNTQWADFDFYQSCIDNIQYANPYNRK